MELTGTQCASLWRKWPEASTSVLRSGRHEGGSCSCCSPDFCSLGQHRALEKLFAFLDDVYLVCTPGRVADVLTAVGEELMAHAHISLHLGKTQVWNRSGVVPASIEAISRAARLVKPDAIVWRGDAELPLTQQGIRVLGAPIGRTEFVVAHLEGKTREHEVLFRRILAVQDTQACWLLLLHCRWEVSV